MPSGFRSSSASFSSATRVFSICFTAGSESGPPQVVQYEAPGGFTVLHQPHMRGGRGASPRFPGAGLFTPYRALGALITSLPLRCA